MEISRWLKPVERDWEDQSWLTEAEFCNFVSSEADSSPAKPLKVPNEYSCTGSFDKDTFVDAMVESVLALFLNLTIYFPAIAFLCSKRGAAKAAAGASASSSEVYIP